MAGKLTDDREMSASRLPGLMGFSNYSTPNDELQFSINAIDGKPRPDISNEAMGWGNTLEPVILGAACQRLGIEGEFNLDKPYSHRSFALNCSLDGIGYGHGLEVTSDPAEVSAPAKEWFGDSFFVGSPPSKPAAMTVTRTSSPSVSSITVPKMMLASGCTAS